MPGRRGTGPVDASLCRRCQASEPALTVRNEPLCRTCFCKYVSTKVVKRMESFRVRHSKPGEEPTLLLALSLGVSSTALLHLLNEHLKGQAEKTGRTGFKLLVLHVADAIPVDGAAAFLDRVKLRYPDHIFLSSQLSDVFSFADSSSLLDYQRSANESEVSSTTFDKFERFLEGLSSATSRADAAQILKRRLIVNVAKQHNCEAVLWADSTTRLAERTLAETAKGRGFSLPWIVADGESPFGIQFYYPMRELLSKEIEAYASILEPPLNDDLILARKTKPAVSTKNTTIDDLMRQYFESVERDYPSIVANVVKTAGKLQQVSLSQIENQCELCELPLYGNAPEKSRLCYGCVRTLPRRVG